MSRILLASFGSLGDLHPYIAVGSALAARGHEVALATCPDYEDAVTRTGLEFVPVPPRLDAVGDRERFARLAFHPRLGTWHLLDTLVYPYLDAAHAVLTRASAGADLLVGHPLTYAVAVVAQQQGVPWLSTVLAPASFVSRHDPPRLALDVLRPAHALGPWVHGLMRTLVWREVWRREAPLRAFRARHGLQTTQVMAFEGQFSPHGTLALFDPVLAAPQADWPERTHVCGAALHDAGEDRGEHAQAARFLAEGKPPLVFALGSAAVWMGKDYFRAGIRAAAELGCRALLLTGQPWGEPLPQGIRAFDYLPYSQVFPHASVVVHQAGIGTLSQALRAGRPQLITPAGFDQMDNAERAARLGVARMLPFRQVTARRLRRELATLLADREAEVAAARVATRVDRHGGERAAQVIEAALHGRLNAPVSAAR
jgi:UDP:flavonoid glycosyltransferase YjiC (YdhE family)